MVLMGDVVEVVVVVVVIFGGGWAAWLGGSGSSGLVGGGKSLVGGGQSLVGGSQGLVGESRGLVGGSRGLVAGDRGLEGGSRRMGERRPAVVVVAVVFGCGRGLRSGSGWGSCNMESLDPCFCYCCLSGGWCCVCHRANNMIVCLMLSIDVL